MRVNNLKDNKESVKMQGQDGGVVRIRACFASMLHWAHQWCCLVVCRLNVQNLTESDQLPRHLLYGICNNV